MHRNLAIYLGGYGVPDSGEPNDQTRRLVQEVIDDLGTRADQTDRITVVLMGGATNPKHQDIWEAHMLQQAWATIRGAERERGDPPMFTATLRLTEHETIDVWSGLMLFRSFLRARTEHEQRGPIILYCEHHRRHRFGYIAKRVLHGYTFTIVPIDFVQRKPRRRERIARVAELGSAILSWNVPGFYKAVELPARLHKTGRV